ncbi:hypothetical protein K0M31_018357 [Melipona bicolor]|uniref:Uncharacterized protein n=1 Tax=Melipona bicolor TaxID=60889 RepID=A0AA40G3A3_9HYME|nr:hypothetical protein K0M31_018357 [Melipona bicolor]
MSILTVSERGFRTRGRDFPRSSNTSRAAKTSRRKEMHAREEAAGRSSKERRRDSNRERSREMAREKRRQEAGGGGCQRFRGMSVFVHGNRQRRSAYANNRVARVARARRVPWVNGQEGGV